MLVKITVSAAGDRFTLNYGQKIEWAELKSLIGNGAENFCVPFDGSVEWPMVEVEANDPLPTVEIERAVVEPVVEVADKFAPKQKGRNR